QPASFHFFAFFLLFFIRFWTSFVCNFSCCLRAFFSPFISFFFFFSLSFSAFFSIFLCGAVAGECASTSWAITRAWLPINAADKRIFKNNFFLFFIVIDLTILQVTPIQGC